MGAMGREAQGRLSQYQFESPYMERQYRQGLQGQLVEQKLALGDLELRSLLGRGDQDLRRLLGMRGLDIEEALGMSEQELRRELGQGAQDIENRRLIQEGRLTEKQLEIQLELGMGNLNLQERRLVFEQDASREDIALRRDLGMRDLDIRQDQLNFLRVQHVDDISLRKSAMAIEGDRAAFERYAFDQQFGLDVAELTTRKEELMRRFGLDERQFNLAGGMSQLEGINRQAEMRLQESGNYPTQWVRDETDRIYAEMRENGSMPPLAPPAPPGGTP
jgi:hypothetical protein